MFTLNHKHITEITQVTRPSICHKEQQKLKFQQNVSAQVIGISVGFSQYSFLKPKLKLEKANGIQLGFTVIYFPAFRQTRPDFFREYLQLTEDITI